MSCLVRRRVAVARSFLFKPQLILIPRLPIGSVGQLTVAVRPCRISVRRCWTDLLCQLLFELCQARFKTGNRKDAA
jgi:hypothetical protein